MIIIIAIENALNGRSEITFSLSEHVFRKHKLWSLSTFDANGSRLPQCEHFFFTFVHFLQSVSSLLLTFNFSPLRLIRYQKIWNYKATHGFPQKFSSLNIYDPCFKLNIFTKHSALHSSFASQKFYFFCLKHFFAVILFI